VHAPPANGVVARRQIPSPAFPHRTGMLPLLVWFFMQEAFLARRAAVYGFLLFSGLGLRALRLVSGFALSPPWYTPLPARFIPNGATWAVPVAASR